MSIQGIEIKVTFTPPVPFTDEWIDAIYASLEKNMAVVSVDVFVDEPNATLKFLFGIDNFLDSEGFTEEIASEAIDLALEHAAGPNIQAETQEISSSKVLAFA